MLMLSMIRNRRKEGKKKGKKERERRKGRNKERKEAFSKAMLPPGDSVTYYTLLHITIHYYTLLYIAVTTRQSE